MGNTNICDCTEIVAVVAEDVVIAAVVVAGVFIEELALLQYVSVVYITSYMERNI